MGEESNEPAIARFDEATGYSEQYVDTGIPGYHRTVHNLIGTNVAEDTDSGAAIEPEEFNLAVVEAPPDNGAALHDHETVEVFMPLTGTWEITWGEEGENAETLEPRDTIQVPPGNFRAFRNVGDEEAYLLALTGGVDPGRATWADAVLEEAKEYGLGRDEEGNLVRTE